MRITVRENASSRGFYDRYEAATDEWPVPALFGGALPAKSHGESPGEALLQMLLSLERDGLGSRGRKAEVEDETGHLEGWSDPAVHVSPEAWERRPKAREEGFEGGASGSSAPEPGGEPRRGLRERTALAWAVSAAASRRQVKAPGGDRANREEIESREGREHVLLWWHVTAEEAQAEAEHSGGPAYGEHDYVQVWRANQVGANNRPRGGARPLLEGPATDPERFRAEIGFLRSSLANDELY